MNISVQSKTLELTQALRGYAQRQVLRIFRRLPRVSQVTVFLETVAKKKNDVEASIAKIKIELPGKDIVVERRSKDLYQAITEVSHSAAQTVTRFREKRLDSKRMARLHAAHFEYTG
jgi:ribosomal subunit interface protein